MVGAQEGPAEGSSGTHSPHTGPSAEPWHAPPSALASAPAVVTPARAPVSPLSQPHMRHCPCGRCGRRRGGSQQRGFASTAAARCVPREQGQRAPGEGRPHTGEELRWLGEGPWDGGVDPPPPPPPRITALPPMQIGAPLTIPLLCRRDTTRGREKIPPPWARSGHGT